ncbi:PEP-CTERM sorting domain-containing protein [Kamptonema cortianum]|nr:PEP-CTERM sorting domain-containing protein [Geitlerinema splendidum]MDK3156972.1 PEP-CTERM sorting domain-containing protein [Kamptonema cortianum]
MKKHILIATLVAAAVSSQAQLVAFDNHFDSGGASNYSGFAVRTPAATGGVTNVFASQLTVATGAGLPMTNLRWSTYNASTNPITARMRIRLYADNAGMPGTYITGTSFSASAFSGVQTWTWTPSATYIIPASGVMWLGLCYDNVGTSATDADLAFLGTGLWKQPASVGSTPNSTFVSTAPSSGLFSNLAGSLVNYTDTAGAPIVMGWHAEVAPEPGTMALLAAGVAGLVARRRRQK